LVDRLWPRGISRQKADVDLWLKEVAPSTMLRKWFGHKAERWAEFQKKYKQELKRNRSVDDLRQLAKKHKQLTLVYSAKDEKHNQAILLKEFCEV
jgi:uncharacterized protein YeaO (DUF488 family)